MRNEVRYVEGGGQRTHALYAQAEPRTPLDELMEAEDQSGYTGSWLGRQVLEFCFADGMPWDWRMARGRLAALIVRVLPEERAEMGKELQEALEWFQGKAVARVPMDRMPLAEEEMEVLLLWMCSSRKQRRLREAVMRLYLLALEILPDSMRTKQEKTMTLDHMAAAFGEPGNAARARWSWRAKQLLAGLPRMKWQRVKGGMPGSWQKRMNVEL